METGLDRYGHGAMAAQAEVGGSRPPPLWNPSRRRLMPAGTYGLETATDVAPPLVTLHTLHCNLVALRDNQDAIEKAVAEMVTVACGERGLPQFPSQSGAVRDGAGVLDDLAHLARGVRESQERLGILLEALHLRIAAP